MLLSGRVEVRGWGVRRASGARVVGRIIDRLVEVTGGLRHPWDRHWSHAGVIAEGSGELQLVGLARLDASGYLQRALLVRSTLRLAHLPCCALWWTRERFNNTQDGLFAFEDKFMNRIYCLFQWLTGLGCQDESYS